MQQQKFDLNNKLPSLPKSEPYQNLGEIVYPQINHYAMKVKRYFKDQRPPQDGSVFTDDIFPAHINSILAKDKHGNFTDPIESRRSTYPCNPNDFEWLRAKDIFPGGKFSVFEGKLEMDDLNQGSLGDCYMVAALGAMTEFPQLVVQIFRTLKVQENGCYELVFKINGEWQIVLVDDYFPCYKGSKNPIFIRPNGAEIWTMLFEKAWAKVNGGYSNCIAGWATEVLSTVTSFPIEHIYFLNYTNEQLQEIWAKILDGEKNNYIMATSTKPTGCDGTGIVGNHAYSLLSAYEGKVKGKNVRLLRLRNPWGRTEWNGAWSDNSNLWTDESKNVFNVNPKKEDDGAFYINFEDYCKYYDQVEFCMKSLPDASVSIKIPKERVSSNNMYELVLEKSTEVDVSIIKKNYRFKRTIKPDQELITNIIIVKKDPINKTLIYDCSKSSPNKNPNLSLNLEAGNYLIYFNVNYESGSYDKKRKYVICLM